MRDPAGAGFDWLDEMADFQQSARDDAAASAAFDAQEFDDFMDGKRDDFLDELEAE